MKITKDKLKQMISEEIESISEDEPGLNEQSDIMSDLGAALENAAAAAQRAIGSAPSRYEKKLAQNIYYELENLIETMWEV